MNNPVIGKRELRESEKDCLVEWLQEQAPYWRDALKKAGVEL